MVPIDLKKVQLTPHFSYARFAEAPAGDIGIRIEMYADFVQHAMLDYAKALSESGLQAGYAALTIALTYFEGYWAFKTGKDHTGRSGFRNAFLEVFPPSMYVRDPGVSMSEAEIAEDIARRMYTGARCGIYHIGLANAGIFCSTEIDGSITIQYPMDNKKLPIFIGVNPTIFVADIEDHFDAYLEKLRNPASAELRQNFLKVFKGLETFDTLT